MKKMNVLQGLDIDTALLQQILDALPVGIWIADPSGQLLANNSAGSRIWAGERWLRPEDYGEFKAWWSSTGKLLEAAEWGMSRAIATGEVSQNEMVDIECFDGSRKTILNSAMPIYDADGQIRACIAVNQEITDLKRVQDDLVRVRNQLAALSGAALSIQEQERKRLSMELHDEIGQTLSALKIVVETARRHCKNKTLADYMQQASEMADTLVSDVREIARRLRPPPLDDLGLVAALRWHLDRVARAATLEVRFDAETLTQRLSSDLELGCFRIAQEAVSNVMRHAAASCLTVTLEKNNHHLTLCVRDDGCGFAPESLFAELNHPLGLLGMRERAAMLGGELRVRSTPGQGAEVQAIFPLGG